ncbi:hypothetical protein SKAU_G00145360 [Synaphobranchus kaupii]|uniref:Uncharacterized protein n=1 Tax=Synaphobranchus kaupii TaxID=118154 RepID=A0A9Q1J4T7_SYNKA|nr:hypothetical protein SKAU_G00145360 [Synaphobranchus kaupii]
MNAQDPTEKGTGESARRKPADGAPQGRRSRGSVRPSALWDRDVYCMSDTAPTRGLTRNGGRAVKWAVSQKGLTGRPWEKRGARVSPPCSAANYDKDMRVWTVCGPPTHQPSLDTFPILSPALSPS